VAAPAIWVAIRHKITRPASPGKSLQRPKKSRTIACLSAFPLRLSRENSHRKHEIFAPIEIFLKKLKKPLTSYKLAFTFCKTYNAF